MLIRSKQTRAVFRAWYVDLKMLNSYKRTEPWWIINEQYNDVPMIVINDQLIFEGNEEELHAQLGDFIVQQLGGALDIVKKGQFKSEYEVIKK